jgi:hypothetical protein
VGVVVAKWTLPLPQGLASALKALDENKGGMQFTGTQQDGKQVSYAESQLTAALLSYYGQVSQVYIGEAIAASELTTFLDEKSPGILRSLSLIPQRPRLLLLPSTETRRIEKS